MRTTVRYITLAITGFVTGFALVLLVGLAWIESAHADRGVMQYPPAPTFYGYTVTGNYANGFTATNDGETLSFPSWRTAIDACKADFEPHTYYRAACRANERQVYRNLRAQRQITRLNG